MSPNALLQCLCQKAQIVIRNGIGVCSSCGKSWVLEATWTPPPAKGVPRTSAPGPS